MLGVSYVSTPAAMSLTAGPFGVNAGVLFAKCGTAARRTGDRRLVGSGKMLFRALLGCVRVVVLFAVLGVIGYVIFDNLRSGDGRTKTSMPPPPKAGDLASSNDNVVACPVAEDALKVINLLRSNTDRQPAASYSVEHGCTVLSKLKDYKIEAYSTRYGAACLQVPGRKQCYWASADVLTIKQSSPPP